MTKEMYDSLKVTDLREIAAKRGIKVPNRIRKADLIQLMLDRDAEEEREAEKKREEEKKKEQENSAKAAAESSGTSAAAPSAEQTNKPQHRRVVRNTNGRNRRETGRRENGRGRENRENRETKEAAVKEMPVQAETPAPAPVETVQPEPQEERREVRRSNAPRAEQQLQHRDNYNKELDSGDIAHGILEVMNDGFGFIRSDNYMPGDNDVYVAPSQIRRFNLKTGDIITGNIRVRTQSEKFSALLYVTEVNGLDPEVAKQRRNFEDMTPIFPNERIRLERPGGSIAMRIMDLMCPVGKGQRGMIVSPPKAGKTTLVKQVAKSVQMNNPEIHLIILLIDERPEEVTDIKEAIAGPNIEVIYSTFDELPEHHKRVAEMTIERAKRLVEQKQDVMILLDSITRLTRAYNMTEQNSGRTLSGGLDPAALHMPKRFFGAARNMREGGSLTILATALIETGSKMDDVVYEEFKGTGNMEMVLNRKLSERRVFPAIDLAKSGTRRDDLLLTPEEQECVSILRSSFIGSRAEEATDSVINLFSQTKTNGEFVKHVIRHQWSY